MSKDLQVANMALSLLGADPIGDFDESSHNARTCKLWFTQVRDSLLRAHPWKFAEEIAGIFDEWDSDKHYFEGDRVEYSDNVYISLKSENNDNQPDTSAEWWDETGEKILTKHDDTYYNLPDDCIKINSVDLHRALFRVHDNKIRVFQPFSRVYYTKKIEDLDKADPLFIRALSYALAIDIAPTMAQSSARQSQLEEHYRSFILPEARSMDAFESTIDHVRTDTWENARLK